MVFIFLIYIFILEKTGNIFLSLYFTSYIYSKPYILNFFFFTYYYYDITQPQPPLFCPGVHPIGSVSTVSILLIPSSFILASSTIPTIRIQYVVPGSHSSAVNKWEPSSVHDFDITDPLSHVDTSCFLYCNEYNADVNDDINLILIVV